MEIYWRLSVIWAVDGNIQEAVCDVESEWKFTGG